MKRAVLLFTFLFALSVAASAQALAVGGTLESFSLPDTNGKTQTLNELRGKNGTVIVFVSAVCPVVRGYNERLNQIAADYKAKGINLIGVNSNATESLAMVKTHSAEVHQFPVLIDKGAVLADKLGAKVTPEAFYIDAKNVLIYHGAVDNDKSGRNITEPYLRAAFDASLAGKKVERTSANAFGCSIRRTAD